MYNGQYKTIVVCTPYPFKSAAQQVWDVNDGDRVGGVV